MGMKERIGRDDVKVYVAIKNGQPIGYVYCQTWKDNKYRASVRNISVLPKFRNMGVGSALMARSFEFLRKNAVQPVRTVTETAEGFYKKVGFKEDARFMRERKWISETQD